MNTPTDPLADHRAGIEYLQKQLAAEQEAKEKLMTDGISERRWSAHLRIQLAAEVEKVNKLQQQLAAERQKVKELEKDKGVLDFIREQRRKADSGELGPEYQLK